MKTFGVLFCMVWAVVQLSQATVPTVGATEGVAVKQSFEEALAQDLSLIAKAKGWTVAQAAAQHRAAEVVGAIAEQVSEARPGSFPVCQAELRHA